MVKRFTNSYSNSVTEITRLILCFQLMNYQADKLILGEWFPVLVIRAQASW